jgi:hypothetical protein
VFCSAQPLIQPGWKKCPQGIVCDVGSSFSRQIEQIPVFPSVFFIIVLCLEAMIQNFIKAHKLFHFYPDYSKNEIIYLPKLIHKNVVEEQASRIFPKA